MEEEEQEEEEEEAASLGRSPEVVHFSRYFSEVCGKFAVSGSRFYWFHAWLLIRLLPRVLVCPLPALPTAIGSGRLGGPGLLAVSAFRDVFQK